jgi:hypothetical protein
MGMFIFGCAVFICAIIIVVKWTKNIRYITQKQAIREMMWGRENEKDR